MSKRRKSNFGGLDVSDHAKEQVKKGSKYGYLDLPKGVRMLNLKEGVKTIYLDFLPYLVTDPKHPDRNDKLNRAIDGEYWYRRPFKRHASIGADNKMLVCPTSINKKCPICEYVRDKLDNQGAEWEEVETIAAKNRSLFVVIPIDNDDNEEEIHVWDMSDFLFHDELMDHLNENPEDGKFAHPYEGKTAEVKLKWKKFGKNKYPETGAIEFEDRDEYDESILDEAPDLDSMLTIMSYKEINNIFLEVDEEDEDEYTQAEEDDAPEEETTPTRKPRSGKKPTRKPRREREPEEEPEEDEDNEEETPTRRSGKKPTGKKPTRKRPSNKDDKCPHGHRFGVDTEEKDECDTCELWSECIEAKENE